MFFFFSSSRFATFSFKCVESFVTILRIFLETSSSTMSTAESEEAMPASILAIEYAVDSEASLDVDISHIPAHYCELCGQSFSRSSVLLKHQRNIHKQDVVTPFTLTCSICKEGLCSSARYASHLLEKHQIQVVVNKFSCSDLAGED